ncbi:MAG: hypothetical protein HDS79_02525 [Bacteroidales bacterium]|nr:hypothetical protein [Bacteroidales bacterium]
MRHNIGIIGKDRQSRDGNGFALKGGDGPKATDRVGTETASRRREVRGFRPPTESGRKRLRAEGRIKSPEINKDWHLPIFIY